jgi:trimethylamine--corrinoid protein Co-methyltransferase
LFDYNSDEQWKLEGAKDAYQRANQKYKELLASYEAPELDPGVEEALRHFMGRRQAELVP